MLAPLITRQTTQTPQTVGNDVAFDEQALINAAHEYAKNVMSHWDASHDYHHVLRVLRLAKSIASSEQQTNPSLQYSTTLLTLAALLHDVGDQKYQPNFTATDAALEWLLSQGAPRPLAERVQTICANVSYSHEMRNPEQVARLAQAIPELAAVQDADRLDAIGAVGMARLCAYGAAKMNQPLDKTMDHVHVKLLRLEGRMKTATGRKLAKERTERLRVFLGWWEDECGDVGAE